MGATGSARNARTNAELFAMAMKNVSTHVGPNTRTDSALYLANASMSM